jgi:hypothetical protein
MGHSIKHAYLVTVSSEVSRWERLVLAQTAGSASDAALAEVFQQEREKWTEADESTENPFWVSSCDLIARNNTFNGSTGIIIL